MSYTVDQIAAKVGGTVAGDGSIEITKMAGIEEASPGDLSFISNKKYERFIETTSASAVIVRADMPDSAVTLIRHADPYYAFMQAVRLLHPPKTHEPTVHPSAVIAQDAVIDPSAHIGPHVVIDAGTTIGKRSVLLAGTVVGCGCTIGEDCLIHPNVTVRDRCTIGSGVIIHSGTVIGSDGFGYATHQGVHHKIEQIGNVVIEDDVEIGSNVSIDRAALGSTRIGRGTKIDNLVQIAHNVEIGHGCIVVAQVGISGSTQLGNYVVLAGQVGLVGHIKLGDGVRVGAQSGVSRDVEAGGTVFGSPAKEYMREMRIEACLENLPEHIKLLKKIAKEIDVDDESD